MKDVILRTAARLLLPVMLAFSLFLLLRGHDEPGGGFSGGLVAATALSLWAFAFGVASLRAALRIDPHNIAGAGLLFALTAGLIGMFAGEPFLTGQWREIDLAGAGLKLGTPLLFDTGVYVTVLGATLLIVFGLMEE
jgi:multicomponent Na+:H+ antiporter subunit B